MARREGRPAELVARALVRLFARAVPASDRARWRREWLAELEHAWRASPAASTPTLLRRSLLSLRDAFALRARRKHPRAIALLDEPWSPFTWIRQAGQDARLGARSLRTSPGFAAVTIATMALGIGATTVIFSLVNGILLQPLAYPQPERLVMTWPENWFSTDMFLRMEPYTDSYTAIAGYEPANHAVVGREGSIRVQGPRVTAAFFDVLGLEMAMGRGFQAGDDRPGSDVVVLTHRFWRDALGADPEVLGTTLRVRGRPRTIVGVLPAGADVLQNGASLVLPWMLDLEAPDATSQDLKLLGRLRDDASIAAAAGELEGYVAHLAELYGGRAAFGTPTVAPLRDILVGDTRPTLLLLFGAVGLTLLIATANVANLLLSRALSRQREMSVRVALGARHGRLIRQSLTETTVLGVAGALPGIGLAAVGLPSVVSWLPTATPRLHSVGIDGSALAFAVGIALLTAWMVGIVPALHAGRSDVRAAVATAARGSEGRPQRSLRSAIVVAEVALAVTLVASSGLLIKSFLRVLATDSGLQPDGLVTFDLRPEPDTLTSAAAADLYFERIRGELDALPGVRSVAEIWKVPFREDGGINGMYRADVPIDREAQTPLTRWRPVHDDYFTTAGIRLLRGRTFDARDRTGAESVAVISEAAARTLFPDGDAIGEQILVSVERDEPMRVIGIVADLKLGGLDQASPAVVYRPYTQLGALLERYGFYGRWLMLRLDGPPAPGLAAAVRQTVRRIDPTALVADYTTMEAAIGASLSPRRVTMTLLATFAGTALLLGAIGIYGVMAYAVRSQRQEIGIRVALGATRARIMRRVLTQALRLAALGSALGLLLTLLISRSLASFLFEVEPNDPLVLALAVATASLLAVASALQPAVRAGRQDPARTLAADG